MSNADSLTPNTLKEWNFLDEQHNQIIKCQRIIIIIIIISIVIIVIIIII